MLSRNHGEYGKRNRPRRHRQGATRRIDKEYAVKGPANKGRYDVARAARPGGSVIDQLLVDKQTGSVQFLSRRA